MATLTYEARTLAAGGSKAVRKPGLFTRMIKAIEASRMKKAEMEVRRIRALMADTDPGFKEALLPFQGE
jgi:hypothetical protein